MPTGSRHSGWIRERSPQAGVTLYAWLFLPTPESGETPT